MFNEILRIKPVLDTATAKQMEDNLSVRFSRVAQRFGSGLRSVIKGSFLGISLGLISKLLNPIEALEDKIKGLLGQGSDIRDFADRLKTSPGQLKQLEDVATSIGVTPDQFKDMLTKYAQAVEKGREELANPFQEPSASTIAIRQFVGEKDLVKSFTDFITSLQATGKGSGSDLALSERAKRILNEKSLKGETLTEAERQSLLAGGEIRRQTGVETRQAFEKEIFGEAQSGAARRLIEANVPEVAQKIKEPTVDKLNESINKASQLADQKRALDVQNQTSDFVSATNKLSGQMVTQMAQADKLQLERETKQLDSFADLKKASIAIEEVKGLFIEANTYVSKGVGYLSDIGSFIGGLKQSRLFKGIFGGKE